MENKTGMPTGVAFVILAIIGIILLVSVRVLNLSPLVVVGTGERGIVTNFGKVTDRVLDEGIHIKYPFVQSVKKVSVRIQKQDIPLEAASNDLQDVKMDGVINYHIDPKQVNIVYQKIGDNEQVYENIVKPNTNEIVKSSTSFFKAESIIKERQSLKNKIDKSLEERLKPYGIVLDDISLVNIDFSKEFNDAIESKQVAELDAQRAVFIAQKALQEGQAKINIASAEAQAQRLQQSSLTPLIIQKQLVDALERGKITLPSTLVIGGNQGLSDFILNLNTTQ